MNDSVLKYFLDKKGIATKRIAGKPGAGHIAIASTVERLVPGSDVYQQMFALGYARVVETDSEVIVGAPKALTADQKIFLKDKKRTGKSVSVNNRTFVETREKASRTAVKQPG